MRSRSLLWSFNYAIDGLVHALRTQRNMRIHMTAAVAVLAGSLFFRISRFEFIAILIAIAFVFVTELVNTAVEAAVDVATEAYDPLAKIAKDVAAAAVFVAAIAALAIGYLVFIGHVSGTMDILISRVRHAPADLTIIALVLTSVIGLVVKAITRKGTYMRGGWPSMHTASAAAAGTAIAYVTASAGAAALALLLVALVGQSRVENGAHTVPQVLVGAALGTFVTTALFQLFWF